MVLTNIMLDVITDSVGFKIEIDKFAIQGEIQACGV